jgi:hypothetical protein
MRLRRSALANRVQRRAQLQRTARIWLPIRSRPLKRTARRQQPLPFPAGGMRFKLRRSAVKAALKLHIGRCKRSIPTS